jgi:hypothetical protein
VSLESCEGIESELLIGIDVEEILVSEMSVGTTKHPS